MSSRASWLFRCMDKCGVGNFCLFHGKSDLSKVESFLENTAGSGLMLTTFTTLFNSVARTIEYYFYIVSFYVIINIYFLLEVGGTYSFSLLPETQKNFRIIIF